MSVEPGIQSKTTQLDVELSYAVITCEIKSFQIIMSAFVDVPTEIILPKIISKLFRRLIAASEYFLTYVFNVAEIILK